MSGDFLQKYLVNKLCCLGDIVHAECIDPQPLHCRYSSHLIQHAPHFDGTKQDLLGELLYWIGTDQKAELLVLKYKHRSLILQNYLNRIYCVN